jgi:hypothetical protein|tara:strand:- start:135 stop:512 length:378 start_codon:yes stop_codon:yes gene_type:complete
MIENKHLVIGALFIILMICVIQKTIQKKKEGFIFKKQRNRRDRKAESLEKINNKLEKDIEYFKKDLRLEKNKDSLNEMLIELHENIGNETVKNLYYKNKDKTHRNYNQQQEGLNNLAKYLKKYND